MSDPITAISALLATLGKLMLGAIPAALGAALSLRLNTRDLTPRARLIAFAGSFGLAWYAGEAIAQHYAVTGPLLDLAKLAAGIYGLSLITAIHEQLPSILPALRRRFLGDV